MTSLEPLVGVTSSASCRISNFGDFAPAEFDSLSCAACFYFIYLLTDPYLVYRTQICDSRGVLVCPAGIDDECNCDNPRYVFNVPDFALNRSAITPLSNLQLIPPLPEQFDLVTRECCAAAKQCCRKTLLKTTTLEFDPLNSNQPPDRKEPTCDATWDGWNCFEASATPANLTASCPPYIYGIYPQAEEKPRYLIKTCTSEGWLKFSNREYTDYAGCTFSQDVRVRLITGIITFLISVIVLLPAVLLLRIRKQPMFVLHRHLLISFLLYGILYLVNVSLFVVDSAPLSGFIYTNHIFCRLLFSAQLRFLRLTNFSWMLAEGVYLYRLLHSAQHSEGESLTYYKILCWGIPAVITFFYMFVRGLYDEIGMCWVENSSVAWVEWSIILPSLLAITVNVLLLTLVMFILVKKLRGDPHLERIQYQKAVRGALMLIPVFGIQQLLTIYRLNNTVYQAIDQSLNGLQGLFVALIVCYTNRNVIDSTCKWWDSQKEKRALGTECRQRLSVQEHSKLLLKPTNNNNKSSNNNDLSNL
ncbi:unnamed protein product [Caenorhabditis auriculariae]|uniref:G-protein coupled receptors family 2 profile 2 domain-containing protein n=1 Tax=Caenorhabditis auriculariae TaxID=2777116 RepID=A0A8S1GSP0_9PELO|nr:unnamed protein product [Caenorhabditis auriculariae]